jgi:carboxypeptidase family protein
MHRPGPLRAAAALTASATLLGLLFVVTPRSRAAGADQPETSASDATEGTATVAGAVRSMNGAPVPRASVRLREVTTGRLAGTTTADDEGRLRFERVLPGAYVLELTTQDKVVATGPLFAVRGSETVASFVRRGAKPPAYSGFFKSAAATAISTAASLGITAVGSSGVPSSPR